MSKKERRQRAEVCQRLIEMGGHFGRVWTVDGPSSECLEKMRSDNPEGYKDDALWLALIALDFWDGGNRVTVRDLNRLTQRQIGAVAKLIQTGWRPMLVDLWLHEHDPRQMSFRGDGFPAVQA